MEKYHERSFCFSSRLQFECRTRITNVSMLFLHSSNKLTNLVLGCSRTQVANVAVKTKITRIFNRNTVAQKCHGNFNFFVGYYPDGNGPLESKRLFPVLRQVEKNCRDKIESPWRN